MAKSLLGALALASLPHALAFRNTSPYFLYSTADLNLPADHGDVARVNSVVDNIFSALDGCPTKTYLVVRQKGVSSADFSDAGRSAPRLSDHLGGKSEYIKSTMVVSDVIEDGSSAQAIAAHLRRVCGAEVVEEGKTASDDKQRLVEVSFAAPPADRELRTAELSQRDQELQQLIAKYTDDFDDFTVIYTSTPQTAFQSEHPPYEMENPFGEPVQMELKRDLSPHRRAALSNQAGLFERYQYFTPGLFMGITAIVPLFLIVVVGVKALLSLEVSYFAFSKEMGPAAQRKQ